MRINHKILSIPPYISTAWKNIASLHVESQSALPLLVIILASGTRIEVPNLDLPIIEAIFAAHAKSVDQEQTNTQQKTPIHPPQPQTPAAQSQIFSFGLPMRLESGNLENMGTMLQHNPDQGNTPDLPKEILSKIAGIAKTVGVNEEILPKAEPHCNCPHCQISRAIYDGLEEAVEEIEELVTLEDLKFRDWEVKQTADKLFLVTNPLDMKEHYSVFLGEPIGCTCGDKNCEHVRAVLNS